MCFATEVAKITFMKKSREDVLTTKVRLIRELRKWQVFPVMSMRAVTG